MRLLLDTHVWLWALLEPERLQEASRSALADPGSELYLSPISVWEVLVLAERGRVELSEEPKAWVEASLARSPVREAPLSWNISCRSRELALRTGDPADRFLAATAAERGFVLMTADRHLLACDEVRTLRA